MKYGVTMEDYIENQHRFIFNKLIKAEKKYAPKPAM